MRPRNIVWCWPLLTMLLSGTVSCSSVQPADVVGTWVMTDASRRRLPSDAQEATAQIVLDASGAFVATDLRGLFSKEERDARILDSGRGGWKLVTLGGEQKLMLEFRQRTNTTDPTPFGRALQVSRGSLSYFIGGPDVASECHWRNSRRPGCLQLHMSGPSVFDCVGVPDIRCSHPPSFATRSDRTVGLE
jgi:hypothetical protein